MRFIFTYNLKLRGYLK